MTTAPALAADAAERDHAHVKVELEGVEERVELARGPAGDLRFELRGRRGERLLLTPEEFARRVFDEQTRLAWWERLLNITSPWGATWVALGFLGQLLFTGRMLVQWVASERRRESVVPPVFWWLSLAGATMLLVYFVWRRDAVGILGQATGWVVYGRNLWLIYRGARSAPVAPAASGAAP